MVKKKQKNLLKSGIYKYLRHPQNFGIIIMGLPLMLFIPGFEDIGIRVGEVVSWGTFTFLVFLYSYLEEWSLLKKYNEEFIEYYRTTGFFIPKFRKDRKKYLTRRKLYKKIVIAFLIFILLFLVFYTMVFVFEDYLITYK